MMNFGLHLRCEPTWTVEQIVAETRAMKRRNANLKLVVVDYLQLVPTAKDFGAKRSDQVAYISRTLKRDVSAANGIAVVVLSQLNDDGKTLDSRAPGQDASNVLFIEQAGETRDPVTRKAVKKEGGLRVAKNRNGPRGHLLPIRLEGASFCFEEREMGVVRQ
ncbi:DnaB-like helicase C-terminal domain-containing protein [Verrucomicrobium spinosum]|nr:DnaB-like helicase C-terminal domain-containing protein [Verrucomicrobium spinosum]